jgi:hypothetical protein
MDDGEAALWSEQVSALSPQSDSRKVTWQQATDAGWAHHPLLQDLRLAGLVAII